MAVWCVCGAGGSQLLKGLGRWEEWRENCAFLLLLFCCCFVAVVVPCHWLWTVVEGSGEVTASAVGGNMRRDRRREDRGGRSRREDRRREGGGGKGVRGCGCESRWDGGKKQWCGPAAVAWRRERGRMWGCEAPLLLQPLEEGGGRREEGGGRREEGGGRREEGGGRREEGGGRREEGGGRRAGLGQVFPPHPTPR